MTVGAAAFAGQQNNKLSKATTAAARSELSSASISTPDAEACGYEAAMLALSD